MGKYNVSRIMSEAHRIYYWGKYDGKTWSQALNDAWRAEKVRINREEMENKRMSEKLAIKNAAKVSHNKSTVMYNMGAGTKYDWNYLYGRKYNTSRKRIF